jgi:hypothetical protein
MLAFPNHRAFGQQGGMDARGEAQAKEALTLYKQGLYEEAAKIFARLSVEYPEMPVFERNLGACFYYLRKPEPAISNLRNYLLRKQDIAPDDKQVVERWIAEMERLRDQESAARLPPSASPGQFAAAPASVPAPAPAAWPQPLPPPTAAPYPAPQYPPAVAPTFQAPQAQVQFLVPTPSAGPAAPAPAPAPATGAPAALDLSNRNRPSEVQDQGSPFYKTWWFWTGVVVVAGGAVTAYLLASRGGSENACSGASIPCDAIR